MSKVKAFLKEWAPRKVIASKNEKNDEKTCLLIVSSTSGFGNASRLAPSVAEYLSEYFKTVVVPTTHQEHIREIIQTEDLNEYNVAVILGGDGAFSEAVNGMLTRTDGSKVALAHCPGGSGCAIAGQTLGCWKGDDVKRACEIIGSTGKVSKMDVNEISCADGKVRYSTSAVASGIGVDIVELGDQYRNTYYLFGPMFRYILGTFIAFFKYGEKDSYRPHLVTIDDEEPVEMSVFTLAVYNGGKVSQHHEFCKTTVDSGKLGLIIERSYLGFGKHLKYLGLLGKGGQIDTDDEETKAMFYARDITSIKVEPLPSDKFDGGKQPARPLRIAPDGEKGFGNTEFMEAPFTMKVLPKKIDIIVQ